MNDQAFGKYRVRELLARGGMAEIHLAVEQTAHTGERLVVLKRILPDHKDDPDFVEFFVHEARVALQLTHPNIVQAYEFGRENDVLYLAMEYVRGFTVLDVIRRASMLGRAVSLDAAVKIAADIAAALDYAHKATDAQGNPLEIVHRDVSPHNIVIAKEGTAKLVDFGIARASCQAFKTRTGVIKGKFAYLAPEQLRRNARFDHRADLFALGTVTYEMLTRRPLFRGSNDADTVKRILAGRIPPLRDLRPDCPVALAAVVHRALERVPEERYGSGAEMMADLEEAARASGLFPTMTRLRGELESLFEEAAPTSIWTAMSARPPTRAASDVSPGPGERRGSDPPARERRASEPARSAQPRAEPPRTNPPRESIRDIPVPALDPPRFDGTEVLGSPPTRADSLADTPRAELRPPTRVDDRVEGSELPERIERVERMARIEPRVDATSVEGRPRSMPRGSQMPISGIPAPVLPQSRASGPQGRATGLEARLSESRSRATAPQSRLSAPNLARPASAGLASAAAGSGDALGAADVNGAPRTTALAPVLPGPLTIPMPSPGDLPEPLLPAPRMSSPRLDDVSPDPIPDRQLEYFLRLASARRARADTLGLADSSPDARLTDESLAMLFEEATGEPVEHLLGAVPEPTLPVDTAPVTAVDPQFMDGLEAPARDGGIDDSNDDTSERGATPGSYEAHPPTDERPSRPPVERPPMPLRAPAHLTPLPQLPPGDEPHPALDAAELGSSGSAFDTPRPVLVRPRLRDIGTESGEETAISPGMLSSSVAPQAPRPRHLSVSETPPELSRIMRAARRKRHLIWALSAAATLIVALVVYGILAGG
jgi:serine/threonine protein kinase